MQNIKNFRLTEPNEKHIERIGEDGLAYIRFLASEDGQDWYECQNLFSDDTVKIMYDSKNIIRAVIDKPVPERGNIYAVSMFFPVNMSVAEIEGNLPEGFSLNEEWEFDGNEIILRTYPIDELVKQALNMKKKLLSEATEIIAPLQDAVDLEIANEDEISHLLAMKKYRVLLNRVDTNSASNIRWPNKPWEKEPHS